MENSVPGWGTAYVTARRAERIFRAHRSGQIRELSQAVDSEAGQRTRALRSMLYICNFILGIIWGYRQVKSAKVMCLDFDFLKKIVIAIRTEEIPGSWETSILVTSVWINALAS